MYSKRCLRSCLAFVTAFFWSHVLSAQVFVDGDVDDVIVTDHTGGYLGHGVSFADFNGDGNDDLTFTQWTGGIRLFAGDGSGGFELTDEGLGNTGGEPKCALWVDLDNDGDQDLFVTQRLAPNILYARMPDGSLQAVPDAAGMAGSELERAYGASVADYDKDGRLDVYISHFHHPQSNSEPNRLFRSVGGSDLDMMFEDVTEFAGVGNGVQQSFQATWVDLDRDGWLDLHVINDRLQWKDALYRNLGDGTFEDVAPDLGVDIAEYSMSSTVADYDKDGDWDFVISNGATRGNRFLRCEGQPFLVGNAELEALNYQEVGEDAGIILNNLAWGALWFDANNDGWQDLYIGTGTSNYSDYPGIFEVFGETENGFWMNNQGDFPLENISPSVPFDHDLAFSSACADHNKDGAMDFVSHRVGVTARLLNGEPNENHWIQIKLGPTSGNMEAIGAVVTVWKDGVPDMRATKCGSDYLNQNSKRLHFGLGATPTIDSVVVNWPSGVHASYLCMETDAINTLQEDNSCSIEVSEGCTYQVACNYDVAASVDDGSCDWSCVCSNGTIWDEATGTCVSGCTADQNGDGVIGTADLLIFLILFGASCP